MRILRLRLAGRSRPSGRPLSQRARARDRNLARRATGSRHDLRRAAVRPPGSDAEQLSRLCSHHQGMADPAAWRRVDGRGESRHDRRRQGRRAGRGGRRSDQPGRQSFQPALLAVLERSTAAPGRGGPRNRPSAVRPLVARPDLRRARLDRGSTGATTSTSALSLGPSHLSCYGLVFEKGTPLWNQKQSGLVAARRARTRAADVRDDDRAAGRGRAGDVRDLELRPARPRIAAQPGLLGQRRLLRLWSRCGALSPRYSHRPTPATWPPTCGGSRPASERDRPARRA